MYSVICAMPASARRRAAHPHHRAARPHHWAARVRAQKNLPRGPHPCGGGCAEAERQDRAHTRDMAAGSIAAMWRPPRQPARREDIPSARPVRGSGILAFFLEVASRQICPRSFSAAKLRLSCGMTKPFPRFSQKEHARGGDRGAPMWQRRRGEKKSGIFV